MRLEKNLEDTNNIRIKKEEVGIKEKNNNYTHEHNTQAEA